MASLNPLSGESPCRVLCSSDTPPNARNPPPVPPGASCFFGALVIDRASVLSYCTGRGVMYNQHMNNENTVEFTARCRAFANEGVRTNRLRWDGTTLRVYDSVAGHYTACHALSARTCRRLVREMLERSHAMLGRDVESGEPGSDGYDRGHVAAVEPDGSLFVVWEFGGGHTESPIGLRLLPE